MTDRYDVIVVGSGPGGAGVARELSRAGHRVLILERGRDWRSHPLYGRYAGALLYADRHALMFTKQGMQIIRPLMVGGATSMYCGCAAPPPAWLRDRYNIDVSTEADDLARELNVMPLPAELRGRASTRIADAGTSIGMNWQPQDKFMQPARAQSFDCSSRCMLGCRCGAKWNAAEFIDEAVEAGATLQTRTHIERILVEGGTAVGVAGRRGRKPFEARASHIVIAAGGLGAPALLRSAGIEAGTGIAMDTTVMVYGTIGERGMGADPPMTWSCADPTLDVMYSTLIDPWLMYPIIMSRLGFRNAIRWTHWNRTLGIMIKVRDHLGGWIDSRGRVSKGLSRMDADRLDRAEQVARRVLHAAGCHADSIVRTPLRGTHPSATTRIGDAVDTDLETQVRNLYVCDASVFPEALGRPTVLTILALGRRLARRLDARIASHEPAAA